MVSNGKRTRLWLGLMAVAFLTAELIASVLVWRGPVTDTSFEPSFWHYEFLRLQVWGPLAILCFGLALCAVLLVRNSIQLTALTFAFYLFLSSAVEVFVSIRFERNLAGNESALLGWHFAPPYTAEHFYSWLTVLSFIAWTWACARWIIHRIRSAPPPTPTSPSDLGWRTATAFVGAISLVTICTFAWAVETPGDFFANGSAALMPSLLISALGGLTIGWFARPRLRVAILILTGASVAYWFCVPTGWWAH